MTKIRKEVIIVSGHSTGGAGYLTRILKLIDKDVDDIVVNVESGEYQDAVIKKIAADLRLFYRVTGIELNVSLMRVNDFSINDVYRWWEEE